MVSRCGEFWAIYEVLIVATRTGGQDRNRLTARILAMQRINVIAFDDILCQPPVLLVDRLD